MAGPDPSAYWLLIAVLTSSVPLSQEVVRRLYQSAFHLHKSGETSEKIQGDLLSGKVVRLDKDMMLGTIVGPAFEAEIATERGDGIVRFLLTRQGLGEDDDRDPVPAPRTPRHLLN
jgi:hypothetical protein